MSRLRSAVAAVASFVGATREPCTDPDCEDTTCPTHWPESADEPVMRSADEDEEPTSEHSIPCELCKRKPRMRTLPYCPDCAVEQGCPI